MILDDITMASRKLDASDDDTESLSNVVITIIAVVVPVDPQTVDSSQLLPHERLQHDVNHAETLAGDVM